MNNDGRRRSGYGVIGYAQGCEVFRQGKVLGEHTEVYDTEMAGLQAAAEETRRYILDEWTETKPKRIIFYADNSAAITKIFEGAHRKAQQHSKAFRRVIGMILCTNTETKIAISWCPGHSSIIGNEETDKLAKSASLLNPMTGIRGCPAQKRATRRMEVQMDKHPEPHAIRLPPSQQNPPNPKTNREVQPNRLSNVQQTHTMQDWPCTYWRIL